MAYYGGIEGGTTGSRMVILRADGKQVGKSEGPHTNYWHLGMSEAARRIVLLVKDALQNADLPLDTPLKSLGLALSGINTELNSMQMIEAVRRINPNVAERIHACNDAVGTLVTATDETARDGDPFCKQLFTDAGVHLGRHVSAAVRHADKEGLMAPEGIEVVCCGSVFKSWDLLENGFRSGLKPQHCGDCQQGRINLRLLHITAAVGAAILAAKLECGISIPRPDQVTDFLCEISLTGRDSQRDL
ncbi:hypothetical protein EG68_04657 [Paragonimus skrjabini miyazakii]|uniref:N-acetylglucosamine kinase n=1 Tax=Paragonimus skrjabini miyazakii TaxID=59628 RepID=A0A8S9YTI8_9TREM|nr:hypothetical protein EG68_04657 [Paragonimus skrjabini miyazakii]